MRPIPLAALLISLSLPAQAQQRPLLAHLDSLLSYALQPAASLLQQAQSQPQAKGYALDYAVHVDTDWDSARDGQWTQRQGRALWRMRIRSEDALSLSASLNLQSLPQGSTLRIADAEGVVWAEHSAASDFWQSPIVPGEVLILEVELPTAERGQSRIQIDGMQHGYRSLQQLQKSGSCNNDTACPEGEAWDGPIRATARITVNGTSLCSAVLLNNTRADGQPLLLTAEHCGLTADNASATVVYWNYETSRCSADPDGSLRQNQSGGRLLASNPNSDFALLELDSAPSSAFQVYYAGWDSSGSAFDGGAGVHHPRGHEKRISLFDIRPRKVRALVDGEPVQSWEIFWSSGVTEPGSSGSGLFDSAGRVVGQLSGGNSSCDNPDGADVYGRMDSSWNSSSSSNAQLKAWLDPNNSGLRSIDGLDSSSNTSAFARNDAYVMEAAITRAAPLHVLGNDQGARPLRLLTATAEHGQVQIQDNELLYQPAPGHTQDRIVYTLVDRHGRSSSAEAQVTVEDSPAATARSGWVRGGSLSMGLLLLLACSAPVRRRLRA